MKFLGFTIYRSKSRHITSSKTVFQTEGMRLNRARATMKEKIHRMRHWPIPKQVEVINAVLQGHFNYYGIAGNAAQLQKFWRMTQTEWKHSLSKRSQTGRVTWEALLALLWTLDRWGRSLVDLETTLKELSGLGVGFVSLTEVLCLRQFAQLG